MARNFESVCNMAAACEGQPPLSSLPAVYAIADIDTVFDEEEFEARTTLTITRDGQPVHRDEQLTLYFNTDSESLEPALDEVSVYGVSSSSGEEGSDEGEQPIGLLVDLGYSDPGDDDYEPIGGVFWRAVIHDSKIVLAFYFNFTGRVVLIAPNGQLVVSEQFSVILDDE